MAKYNTLVLDMYCETIAWMQIGNNTFRIY
jgi:hypothetical protein